MMSAEAKAEREAVIIRLLERAAAALIDAEDRGPGWSGYYKARLNAKAMMAMADALELDLRRREVLK